MSKGKKKDWNKPVIDTRKGLEKLKPLVKPKPPKKKQFMYYSESSGWDKDKLKKLLATMPEPKAEPGGGYIQIDKNALKAVHQFQQYKFEPGGFYQLGQDPMKYVDLSEEKPKKETPIDWAERWYEKNVGRK